MKEKILEIVVLSILIILTVSSKASAVQENIEIENTQLKIATNFDKIQPEDWKPNDLQKSSKFDTKIGKVLGAIRNSGIVTSVLALMFIGIRSMLGSVEEKSEYKESMPTFLIGIFILLSCTTIPDIIYNIASNF